MLLERLNIDIKHSYEKLSGWSAKDVFLVYHNDADGLSAGAVALKALERLGYKVRAICIEKLMDQIIRYLHSDDNKMIIYVDLGSPHADRISRYNEGKNLTIILDHHDPVASSDPLVYNINPEFYGMRGEEDASGSVITYYFFKMIDPANKDLAPIALIGAQEIPGEARGLIKMAHEDAKGTSHKIEYKRMFRTLQVLGPVGYYQGGPALGLRACIDGLSSEIRRRADELETMRKLANKRMLTRLYKKGLNKLRHVQWFESGNIYRGMGTKVIGTFTSYLSYQSRLIDKDKYILGFMRMPNEIPGLMKLEGKWLKVSARVSKFLRQKIIDDIYPGVNDVLVESADSVGGLGDGHKFAASAVIPSDKLRDFVGKVDKMISIFIS